MYYIIDNEVYAPYEGHDFDGRATDTIEDGVWELYSQDESSYKIEDGKFIALKQQAELEAAFGRGQGQVLVRQTDGGTKIGTFGMVRSVARRAGNGRRAAKARMARSGTSVLSCQNSP